jgi:hypothetical protein
LSPDLPLVRKDLVESRKPDVHSAESIPEDYVHILAILRGVCEAARIVKPRSLIEGRCYRSGRRGGFGNGIVNLAPDLIVELVGEDCIQERFDLVEVEVVGVVGVDGGIES